jgi:dephospho-CoA kinase
VTELTGHWAGSRAQPRALRIGITGPIGCGKSTVASWLGELGAVVIDADQVAREVTPPGSAELEAVVEAFGRGVLRADGSLDRAALGRIVFADPAALAQLEAIVHPAVRPRILGLLADAERAGAPAVVVEAIKLVEGGLAELCDEVWLITCDPEAQRSRLARRASTAGMTPDTTDVDARIAAQGDLVSRLTPYATRVLDTSGSIAESRSRVHSAWRAALAGLV